LLDLFQFLDPIDISVIKLSNAPEFFRFSSKTI
jgi:hypothetical protein